VGRSTGRSIRRGGAVSRGGDGGLDGGVCRRGGAGETVGG
jgi:hypothetical protein